jgi:hypothetical protein
MIREEEQAAPATQLNLPMQIFNQASCVQETSHQKGPPLTQRGPWIRFAGWPLPTSRREQNPPATVSESLAA